MAIMITYPLKHFALIFWSIWHSFKFVSNLVLDCVFMTTFGMVTLLANMCYPFYNTMHIYASLISTTIGASVTLDGNHSGHFYISENIPPTGVRPLELVRRKKSCNRTNVKLASSN